jgi:hypothetical protein
MPQPDELPQEMEAFEYANVVCYGCARVMLNLSKVDGSRAGSAKCVTHGCLFEGIAWNMPRIVLTRAGDQPHVQ